MSIRSETRIPVRIFNAVAGNSPREFNPDQLMENAAGKNKLSDFGEETFLEGMRILCDSLSKESKLHALGRIAAKSALMLTLRNRLELEARWKEHPEVLKVPVERPLLIVGPPRTGTTLLFNLLALDERFRFFRSWEAARPGLPHEDKRLIRKAKQENKAAIGTLNYLRPELKKIHHLAPEKPEECIPLLANSFESDFWSFSYMTKSYFDWYAEQDHDYCYSYYLKQLQWIQRKSPGKRWLLKSPAHLSGFKALFRRFPDALVLQTHRDPKQVIPSISNLKYNFQSMFSYEVNKEYIGETAVDFLSEALLSAFESREKFHYNILDIRYEDLVKNPIDILEQVYERMGESFFSVLKDRAKNYLAANPKNKFGQHKYSIDEIGVENKTLHEKFDFYYDRFKFATV